MRHQRRALCLCLGVAACQGAPEWRESDLEAISVQPSERTLTVGDSLRLSAYPRGPDGSVVEGVSVSWLSGDSSVATVQGAGEADAWVRTHTTGRVQVSAQSGAHRGSATLVVTPPPEMERLRDSLRRQVEGASLEGSTLPVVRAPGDRLVIRAREGPRRAFTDRVTGHGSGSFHLFRGYLPAADGYLVEVVYYPEGGQFLLMDAGTGRVVEVDAPPQPSPDGRRLVTTSVDLVAGHRPNRTRIYRRGFGGLVLEWEVEPRGWGGREARWLDSSRVLVQRDTLHEAPGQSVRPAAPLLLERTAQGWVVRPR